MLSIFCTCIAVINLLDRNYYDTPLWLELIWIAANLYFLFRNRTAKGFYFLSLAQICLSIINMPAIGNHILFQTLVNLYLVLTWSINWFRNKKFPVFNDSLDNFIISDLRHLLLALYFFATFQKLNWDYLDPQVSCAGKMFGFVFENTLPFLPSVNNNILNILLIYSSLFIEGIAPLMLLSKKFKKIGFILLLLLHLFLGSYIIDFNFLCLSFILLFLPYKTVENSVYEFWSLRKKLTPYQRYSFLILFFLLCLHFKFSFQIHFFPRELKIFLNMMLYSFLFIPVYFVSKDFLKNPLEHSSPIKTSSVFVWPFLFLLSVSSLGPYIGFKNITALAMYSNLRTEQTSNHMFLPKGSLQVFKEIDDVVTIPSIFMKKLNSQKVSFTLPKCDSPEVTIPRFEMGRIISYTQKKNIPINDAFFQFIKDPYFVGLSEEFENSSWLKKKLFGFRPVCNSEKIICSW